MSLAAKLRDVPDRAKGPPCTVAAILGALDDEDGDELRAVLADASIPATHIARILTDEGHRVKYATVQRHRRGDCDC